MVSATALADENKDILNALIPPDDISGNVDIEKWMQQMEFWREDGVMHLLHS